MPVPSSPRSRPDTPQSRGRAALLVALIAYGLVTMTICLPSMQEWGTILDASPGTVQLSFSAYVLAYGSLQRVYGPLSGRLGRRSLMLAGLASSASRSSAGAFATGIEALVAVGWAPQDGLGRIGLLRVAFTLGAIAAQAMLPGPRGR